MHRLKYFSVIVCLVFFLGCTSTASITAPNGEVWTVNADYDAVVKFENGVVKIEADFRGHRNALELILPAILAEMPDLTFEKDD